MTTQAPASSKKLTKEHKKVLAGSVAGTTIEWFDFFIYAQAAGLVFATLYFDPVGNNNPSLAQIISWASLGISFLFRPLGAVLAGYLGDRFGRKIVLVLTLAGMGGATVAIGFLPTYSSIGMAAPIILVLLRILQGLSAGGEWGGAAMLAVEHAPQGRRGYFGSFPQFGVPAGMLLATIFMLILSSILSQEQFLEWGWRIPFISSIVLIVIAFWIRALVAESPVFAEMQKLKQRSSAPVRVLFKNHTPTVIKASLIFAGNNAAGYLIIAYFTSYATGVVGHSRTSALFVALLGAIAWLVGMYISGGLSDQVGRKKLFTIGYILLALWAVPTFMLIDTGSLFLYAFAIIVMGLLLGPSYAPQSAMYAEMFPVSVRLSGVSIGYALGSIIGGAFAPMISEMVFNATGTSISIGVYIAVVCVISLIAVRTVPNGIQDRDLHAH